MIEIPEIDKKATRVNVRKFLSQYRRLARLAGQPLEPLTSPLITGMPTTHSNTNTAEHRIIDRISTIMDCQHELDEIDATLLQLSTMSRNVLALSYCTREIAEIWQVAEALHVGSEGTLKKLKATAWIEFAEAYKHGELLEYK